MHDDRDAIRYEAQRGNVLSATEALEQSSDVAAIELAERMGKDRFYQYIRAYGFGRRTGIELPAETRGLLAPPRKWNPTTIGSIPMGQEIGVTPVQLISMVSTIANGGVYLPPHILLQTSDEAKNGKLVPAAYHPERGLPDPLPEGAHRVISTLTAAEMREMMEGVVLHGTGIPAQLNGYSAAGKTGTAEKIDPRTHTYSKTNYIASFAGFAPVNDPAISIVVVMDSPAYRYHYGTQASAPVFHELAQQILEYLGVPYDQPLKSTQEMAAIENHPAAHDAPQEHPDDLNSLFAEVNDLPKDDPLRALPVKNQAGKADADEARAYLQSVSDGSTAMPASQRTNSSAGNDSAIASMGADEKVPESDKASPAAASTSVTDSSLSTVTMGSGTPVSMPGFIGKPMRDVVVMAANLGLNVRVYGSGVAAEQAPPAGTRIPAGTTVIVRFHP